MFALIQKYRSHLSSLSWYFIASVFGMVIGLVMNPLLALNLSKWDYAIIGYYTSFTTLLTPLFHCNLTIFYLRKLYTIDENKRQNFLNSVVCFLLGTGVILFTLYSIVFYLYLKCSKVDIPYAPFASIFFAQIFFSNFFSLYLIKIRVDKKSKLFAVNNAANAVFLAVISIILIVFLQWGATGRFLAMMISALFMGIYSIKKMTTKFELDTKLIREGLSFGWPLTISAILWYFLTGVDRFFLADNGDLDTLGLYNIGLQIAAYMGIFYGTLSTAYSPNVYQAIAQNNLLKAIKIIVLMISLVAFCNVLFIIGAPYLIDLLTAGRYVESTSFARIFAISNIAQAIYYTVVILILAYGYVKLELLTRIIGCCMSIAIYYIMIKCFSFQGAAWGQVIAFVCISLVAVAFLAYYRKSHASL